MVIRYIISGFLVKLITGIDDAMVHIPIIGNIAKTTKGRIAFSIGLFCAILFAIGISFIFSRFIRSFTYYHIISALLILALALSIHFDIFLRKPKQKVEKKLQTKGVKKEINKTPITLKRFIKLIFLGFLTGFATVTDDTIAYSSLFLSGEGSITLSVIAGILCATLLQLYIVVSFSKTIKKIPYKKQMTVTGLCILSILIYVRIL